MYRAVILTIRVTFFALFCVLNSGKVMAASANHLAQLPASMNCVASDTSKAQSYGSVRLRIEDSDSDPMIEVISSKLNFKIGQRHAAGLDFSAKDYVRCGLFNSEDADVDSLTYYCDADMPNSPTYIDVKNAAFRSTMSFAVSNLNDIHICKNQTTCFTLGACKATK